MSLSGLQPGQRVCVGQTISVTLTWIDESCCYSYEPMWPDYCPRCHNCGSFICWWVIGDNYDGANARWEATAGTSFTGWQARSGDGTDTVDITFGRAGPATISAWVEDVAGHLGGNPPVPLDPDGTNSASVTVMVDCGNTTTSGPTGGGPVKRALRVGESTQAFFPYCTGNGNHTILWSIVPNERGETLGVKVVPDSGTADGFATVIAGDRPGRVKLRGADPLTGCEKEWDLTVGCEGCESGDCGAATATVQVNSVDVRIDHGRAAEGESAGHFSIYGREPSLALSAAGTLKYSLARGDADDVLVCHDGVQLQRVRTLGIHTEIAKESDTHYWIRSYATKDVTQHVEIPGQITPYDDCHNPWILPNETEISWEVESPNQNPNELVVRRYTDGVEQTPDLVYQYLYNTQTGAWTLKTYEDGDLLREETTVWSTVGQPPYSQCVRTVKDGLGNIIERVLTKHESPDEPWYEQIVDPDLGGCSQCLNLVTQRAFYTGVGSGAAAEGAIKWQLNPDGSWIWNVYAWDGNNDRIVRNFRSTSADGAGFNANAAPSSAALGIEETRTVYDRESGRVLSREVCSGDHSASVTVAKETHTYEFDTYGGRPWFVLSETVEQFASSASALTSTTTFVSSDPDNEDPLERYLPGPRYDWYIIHNGSWRFNSTTPGASWLEWGSGPAKSVETIREPEYGGQDPTGIFTKHVDYYDESGNHVMREERTGNELTAKVVTEYDWRGRPVRVFRIDPASNSRIIGQTDTLYEDCCGSKTVTDEVGLRTRHDRDAMGRPIQTTRYGHAAVGEFAAQPDVVTTYTYLYDAVNRRRIARVVTASAGTPVAKQASQTEYDLAGRIVSEKVLDASDPALSTVVAETTYSYAFGGRQVTVTRPDTGTEITLRDTVGRVRSVTGTGVVASYYKYDYDTAAGGPRTTVYTGVDQGPRFVATTRDWLGRAVKEVRPAFREEGLDPDVLTTAYLYRADDENGAGQVKKVSTTGPDDLAPAPTLYEYDKMGLLIRHGLNVDRDTSDTLSASSTDRFTETVITYPPLDPCAPAPGRWRQTVTKRYHTNGQSGYVSTTTMERLSGFLYVDNLLSKPISSETATTNEFGAVRTIKTWRDRTDAMVVTTLMNPLVFSEDTRFNGRTVKNVERPGVYTLTRYDGLGRVNEVVDGRGNKSYTDYDGAGRVSATRDDLNNATTYAYHANGVAGAGRSASIENPAGKKTYYSYTLRGETEKTWGDVPQPTWTQYDATYGERWKLHTYRDGALNWSGSIWPSSAGAGDVTEWTHDPATGLETAKTYANGNQTLYVYTPDGLVATRYWARGVSTTYGYDAGTRELSTVDYSNTSYEPDFTYTYTRLGEPATVTAADPNSTDHAFQYDRTTGDVDEVITGAFSRTIRRTLDYWQRDRLAGIQVLNGGTSEYATSYQYNFSTWQLERVVGPGLPGSFSDPERGVWYSYYAGTDHVQNTEFRDNSGAVKVRTVRTLEADRDLIDSIENIWQPNGTPATISKYDYTNSPTLGLRTDLAYSGAAFATAMAQPLGYNDRQELTSSTRTAGSNVHAWTYAYDPIGNRTSSLDDPPGTSQLAVSYGNNKLNQHVYLTYTPSGLAPGLAYDGDGNLVREFGLVIGDASCDGKVDFFDIDAFVAALGWSCSTPGWPFLCPCSNFDADQDGDVDFFDIDAFMARLGQSNVTREYVWDAENRLIGVTPTVDADNVPTPLPKKATYVYDYLGRRVERKVFLWNTSGRTWWEDASEHTRYVWGGAAPSGGWLLLMELNASNQAVKKYTWGLDLAGQAGSVGQVSNLSLESAGGIGGLLAVEDLDDGAVGGDPVGSFLFCYDGNGNAGQLVDYSAANVTAALVAKYEYDPYGALIGPDTNQDGVFDPAADLTAIARANTFRFSTKQWDDATGLGYWGYRYYSAKLGRWISRDPIGEWGGTHLYVYTRSSPLRGYDPAGLCETNCWFTTKCKDFCAGGDAGTTFCKGLSACTCICVENIRAQYPNASDKIISCVKAHEQQHVLDACLSWDDGMECRAMRAERVCMHNIVDELRYHPGSCDAQCVADLADFIDDGFAYCSKPGGCKTPGDTASCQSHQCYLLDKLLDAARQAGRPLNDRRIQNAIRTCAGIKRP